MRIIFGHNSFVIKRLSSKELGIPSELEISEIQLRQKYAHLYFIPVFPLGQVWVSKKNGKLYDVPEQLKHTLITLHHSSRVHIGAFALPILLIVGFLLYYVINELQQYRYKQNAKQELLANGNSLIKAVDELTNKNTFVLFTNSDNDYSYFTGDLFKVLQVNKDKVLLGKIESIDLDTLYKYDFPNSVFNYSIYKYSRIIDSTSVKKDLLKTAIKRVEPFSLVKIDGVSNDDVKLYKIFQMNDAYFINNTNSEADTEYYNEYKNYGLDIVIDSLVPSVKTEEWKLSKQKIVKFGEKFAIKTESLNIAHLYYHLLSNSKVVHSVKISRNYVYNNIKDENDLK